MQPFLAMIMPVEGGGIGGPGKPPVPPLVIWGPGDPRPTLPIAGWDPGSGNFPGVGGGGGTGIWGPNDPRPTNPISGWDPSTGTFPELPEELPDVGPIEWKAAWTEQTGWVVIGIPSGNVPTPSRREGRHEGRQEGRQTGSYKK